MSQTWCGTARFHALACVVSPKLQRGLSRETWDPSMISVCSPELKCLSWYFLAYKRKIYMT